MRALGTSGAGSWPRGRPRRRSWARAHASLAPLLATLLALGVAGRASPAGAQSLSCGPDGAVVVCDIDASALFDAVVRGRFDSGFTNHVLYRVYLYPVGGDEPLTVAVAAFAEVFRLYSDIYYVSRQGIEGYEAYETWEQVVAGLARFRVIVGSAADLPEGSYFAAAIAELNPLSEDHLSRAQSWIASAGGDYRVFEGGDESFFGTFVSLFVSPAGGQAEVSSRFQSTPFVLPGAAGAEETPDP